MKNVLEPLAESLSILIRFPAAVSPAVAKIHKNDRFEMSFRYCTVNYNINNIQ